MPIKRNSNGKFAANGGRKVPTAADGLPGKRGPKPGTKQSKESARATAARERRERQLDAVTEIIAADARKRGGISTLNSTEITARLNAREDSAEIGARGATVRAVIAELLRDKRLVRATRRMVRDAEDDAGATQWTRGGLALPDVSVAAAKKILEQEVRIRVRHADYIRPVGSLAEGPIDLRVNTPSAIALDEVETVAEMLRREAKAGRFTTG